MFKVISLLWVSSFLKLIVFLFLTFGHLIHKMLLANFMLECSEKKKKGKMKSTYMLFASREVRIGKNYARGLE